jgi:hypothetical protein
VKEYLTIWDVVLTPLYIMVLVFIAKRIRNKNYPTTNPLRRYYLPGLLTKFAGVIFIACIHQFYYGGSGDTFHYYELGNLVNSSLFDDSFTSWVKLMLNASPESDPMLYRYTSKIDHYNDPASYAVVKASALLGLISFNSYIPIGLLFAFISYTGIWAMYKTFVSAYPTLHRQLAIAFLFVPSVFVWGSSIFKDTICIFGLGWMTYTSFRIFVNKDLRVKNFVLLIASFYLIGVVKIYILMAFLPSISLWLLLTHSSKIKIPAIRIGLIAFVTALLAASFMFFSIQFSKQLNKYTLENLTNVAEETRAWIIYSSGDEGSAYDLGKIDPSAMGLLSKFPAAVTVTLFRPFLWEVKKPIMLLSALEGLAFAILVLLVFFRNGVLGTVKLIFSSPNLSFFFIYSLIFAFAVGISTGNFGSLSRYKIPCMPFFAALLLILYYHKKAPLQHKKKEYVSNKEPVYHIA